MDMTKWLRQLGETKKPLPLLSFPGIRFLKSVNVRQMVTDSALQAACMKAVADRVDAAAAVSFMDLSVEAEAFGAQVRFSEDEVPTIVGQLVDGVELSCAQFFVVTVITSIGMLLTETPTLAGILGSIIPILYVGIFSSGVAFTLQILAQKDSNPTVVSLLLSLESVFATLSGALILGDQMSGKEYFGCVLMGISEE